jgi:predicted transglutaminase-like cysteine proteinase
VSEQTIWALLLAMVLVGCGGTPEVAQPPPAAQAPTAADRRVAEWHALMADEQEAPDPRKLALVNEFFNRLYFGNDITLWGQDDYWATPEETLRSNGGDCEDFVIGKYYTLRELRVPDERLRLTYVLIVEDRRPHMVLAYYPTPAADPLILDILVGDILPASQRTDLKSVYGFNSGGLWVAGRDSAAASDPARHLSRWRELLRKMEAESGIGYTGN